jgi:hypothetical protein
LINVEGDRRFCLYDKLSNHALPFRITVFPQRQRQSTLAAAHRSKQWSNAYGRTYNGIASILNFHPALHKACPDLPDASRVYSITVLK